MKITFEMVLDDKDVPYYITRSAALLRAYADALDRETFSNAAKVDCEGGVVSVGTESFTCVKIVNGEG